MKGDNPAPTGVPEELEKNLFLTTVDNVYNWGRARSMWPMMFGLACCAIEMIAVQAARFDMSRFGMEIMRASPRQADLMIVSGTVTKKMVPNIVRLYNQMAEPKYVMAMGACATSGGPFKEGYNVVSGIDKYIPVDVYVPGCPPTPEALIYGAMKIHEKVFTQSVKTVPWYRKDQLNEPLAVPVLGPDIYSPQDREELKQKMAARLAEIEAQAAGAAPVAADATPVETPAG
jgi:NADH-quinone oxidoreductase subunit B